jgi:hypothetical protein
MTDSNIRPVASSPIPELTAWIGGQRAFVLTIFAMIAAFTGYTSMYAFRRPFTATGYDAVEPIALLGVAFGYKSIAVISQVVGYTCSKFLGVKFASEASLSRRVPIVIGLILFAEAMLVLFALTPTPQNVLFLFLNGLPLGMVWSMLFGIVEGRRISEFLGLGMSVSVVFASGWVKGVGLWTMEAWHVSEFWMPAVTGLLFVPLLLLSMFMLWHVPPPTTADIEQRTQRAAMRRDDRSEFVRSFFPGIAMLTLGYLCLMAYRSIRDDFMDQVLRDLGHTVTSSDFVSIESYVGMVVIAILCLLWFFRDNRQAVWANLTLIGLGAVLLGGSTVLLKMDWLDPKTFYILNGIGLYVAFVPYQSILMDRLLASLHTVATAAFLISLGDSFGYLSVVATYLVRDVYQSLAQQELPWGTLLEYASYVVMIVVPLMMIGCAAYFRNRMSSD